MQKPYPHTVQTEDPQEDRTHSSALVLIPNLITVLAVFFGFLSILNSFKGDFTSASVYIGLAMVLDGLDGRIARRLNATSPFGREFDSLSDMLSLGAAPAILVYAWGFSQTIDDFGILVSFAFVICAATRLARFNVEAENKKHFNGLPMPGAAGSTAALVFFFPQPLVSLPISFSAAAFLFGLSLLMVSTIRYPSIKHISMTSGNPKLNILWAGLFVATVWYFHRYAFIVLGVFYISSGPYGALRRLFAKKSPE